MGALLIPVIVIIVLTAIVLVAGRKWASREQAISDDLADPTTSTIDYSVPDGQDPVVLLTALNAEGFTATTDPARPQLLHVSCRTGLARERAHARSVIASVHQTAVESGTDSEAEFDVGHVRFTDE